MNRLIIFKKSGFRVLLGTVLMAASSLLLSACTVTSNQGAMLLAAFQEPIDELAAYRWRVRLGDYQSDVMSVALPENFLFANDKDDIIHFNGWVITAVSGLNLPAEVVIEDTAERRRFTARQRQSVIHQCGAWQANDSGGGIIYSQACNSDIDGHYQNRIDVDAAGSIVKIAQHLTGGALLILEKT